MLDQERAMRWRALTRTTSGAARAVFVFLTLAVVLGSAVALVAAGHEMGDTMPEQGAGMGTGTAFATMMETAMTGMDDGMNRAPMTGDPDHDFAAMMIPHHQGAIDMAKAELLYGTNPVLRRLAQEIVVTQNSEITIMQRELQKQAMGGSLPR